MSTGESVLLILFFGLLIAGLIAMVAPSSQADEDEEIIEGIVEDMPTGRPS
jgi:hypothetical protein